MRFARRNVLKLGAGAAGAGVLAAELHSQILAPEQANAIPNQDLNPNQALQQLIEGNQRFVKNKRQNPHPTLVRRSASEWSNGRPLGKDMQSQHSASG
ncbi:MAG: twin-arginine translocation signal domain-containing protein [Myxacorys californica WJT36-NPBG1]|jgi:carbonic anhydrase|nr:twin-arginine translocation signal domain-containing protein [Myxacorys californica WJT36-NPBG1]